MINDYFDLEGGVDTENYVRAQYAPHPVLSGLISKTGLILAIAIVNLIDLGLLVFLTRAARLAGGALRAAGPLHQRLLRGAAAPAQAPRASASRASSWSGDR